MNSIAFSEPIVLHLKTIRVSELPYTLIDNGSSAAVRFAHIPKALQLWGPATTPTYAEIGDYTQAQVEARVAELLATPEDVQRLVAESQSLFPQAG